MVIQKNNASAFGTNFIALSTTTSPTLVEYCWTGWLQLSGDVDYTIWQTSAIVGNDNYTKTVTVV